MENQRVRLSKSMLRQALLKLLQEKPIEKISVYELCRTAQINRTTFYKYYGSQYELLEELQDNMFAELEKSMRFDKECGSVDLSSALKYLEQEREVWRVLINSLRTQTFAAKLISEPMIREIMQSCTPKRYTKEESDYIHIFFCQGGYAIIAEWLNKDNREPCEQIAKLLLALGKALQ